MNKIKKQKSKSVFIFKMCNESFLSQNIGKFIPHKKDFVKDKRPKTGGPSFKLYSNG